MIPLDRDFITSANKIPIDCNLAGVYIKFKRRWLDPLEHYNYLKQHYEHVEQSARQYVEGEFYAI